MMAPQVAQEGASPMSYMLFMASETWMAPLPEPGMPVTPRSLGRLPAAGRALGAGCWALGARPLLAARSGAIPPCGGVLASSTKPRALLGFPPGALLKMSWSESGTEIPAPIVLPGMLCARRSRSRIICGERSEVPTRSAIAPVTVEYARGAGVAGAAGAGKSMLRGAGAASAADAASETVFSGALTVPAIGTLGGA